MGTVMLGKLPPKVDPRTLQLVDYVTRRLRLPAAIDYTLPVKKKRFPMFANDRHPCCTCSAAAHMVQVWSANVGKERILPDRAIIQAYKLFVGDTHKARKHMLDVLNYWRKRGLA